MKWAEMPLKVSFGQPFCIKKNHTNKSVALTSKMATGGHFFLKHLQKSCVSDLNNVRTDYWPTTTLYKFTFGQYIYRQACWE